MPDYEKMYKTLFNAMTDAIEVLQKAQQETEEQYIKAEPPKIHILPLDTEKKAP